MEIQDRQINGITSRINTPSHSPPSTEHDGSCNGFKNGASKTSEICDTITSPAQSGANNSRCECAMSSTPVQSASVRSRGSTSASAAAKWAFLFDGKLLDDNPQKDPKASATSSQSPTNIGSGSQGVSPANLSNGNYSTGFSTNDSIFTYSLTDESQDELESKDATEGERTISASDTCDGRAGSTDVEHPSPISCGDSSYVDKSALIKSVIEKVYAHTITYTVEDLVSFQKSKCLAGSDRTRNIQTPRDDVGTIGTPPVGQKEFSRKKFSARSIKNILKSMSPASLHRKASKSSGSFGSQSSSNLGDSVDGHSVHEENVESTVSENVAPKGRSGQRSGKKSPAFSGASDSPWHKTRTLHNPTIDHLKRDASDSPASCR